MSISYAWEKSMLAVTGMARSTKNINGRIADAYVYHLINIEPDRDLPEDLRLRLAEIREALTRTPARGNEGTVQASAMAMSEEEASEIADKIVEFYDIVCARSD
jgi:hypothetical protein